MHNDEKNIRKDYSKKLLENTTLKDYSKRLFDNNNRVD